MVAGDRLVVGRRAELRVGAAGQVVRVDVVGARARAVQGGRKVVGERGVLLLERLNRAHLAGGPRQAAEHDRGDRGRACDVLGRAGDEGLLGGGLVGKVGGEREAVRGDVAPEALGAGDLAALLVDHRQLVQPDLVDVAGIHVEGRPGADGVPVEGLAIGRGDQARLCA